MYWFVGALFVFAWFLCTLYIWAGLEALNWCSCAVDIWTRFLSDMNFRYMPQNLLFQNKACEQAEVPSVSLNVGLLCKSVELACTPSVTYVSFAVWKCTVRGINLSKKPVFCAWPLVLASSPGCFPVSWSGLRVISWLVVCFVWGSLLLLLDMWLEDVLMYWCWWGVLWRHHHDHGGIAYILWQESKKVK